MTRSSPITVIINRSILVSEFCEFNENTLISLVFTFLSSTQLDLSSATHIEEQPGVRFRMCGAYKDKNIR